MAWALLSEEQPEARALRESEQRFRALSEAAREAVFINGGWDRP